MKKTLALLLTSFLLAVGIEGANRVTTWGSGQVLTHTALNAEYDNIYTGDISRTGGYWGVNDDIPLYLGSSQDAQLEWETAQTQDALVLGLSGSLTWIITEKADIATNYGLSVRTDPALIIHSADAGTVADYLELQHDQTDAVINAGAGGFSLQAAGTEITDVTATGDWVFKGTTPTLTIGDAGAEDAGIVFDGNVVDFYVALDDTSDDLVIGEGSVVGTEPRITIDSGTDGVNLAGPIVSAGTFSTQSSTTLGNGVDDTITMTGSIQGTNALIFEGTTVDAFETIFAITDPTTPDKTVTFQDATGTVALLGFGAQTGTMDLTTIDAATAILLGGYSINTGGTLSNVAYLDQANIFTADQEINGTTPSLTIGDAGGEDAAIFFDDNTYDYHIAFDDTGSNLVIGSGLSVGAANLMSINDFGDEVIMHANTQIGDNVLLDVVEIVAAIKNQNALWFDGATDDAIETIFAITDPTSSDKTITFPDATGTAALIGYAAQSGTMDIGTLDVATAITLNSAADIVFDAQTSSLAASIEVESTGTSGYSALRLKNDVQTWVVQTSTDDKFKITDVTGGNTRITINTTGSIIFNTDTITINGLTYTWPSSHAAGVLTNNGSGALTWTP
jgi:hypothetical protein